MRKKSVLWVDCRCQPDAWDQYDLPTLKGARRRREEERVGNNDKGKYIGIHKDTAVTGKLIGMREENL